MHSPRGLVRGTSWLTFRIGLSPRLSLAWQRRIIAFGGKLARPPKDTAVAHVTLAGRPVERTTVGASERPRAIVYLHGGAYVLGTTAAYRACAGYLARAAGAVVYNVDYSLAPEATYPTPVNEVVAAVRELIDVHGYEPRHIAIAGDSAGGGLTVAAARRLADDGIEVGALLLFSPWTDPSDEDHAPRDFVVNREWGKAGAAAYRGAADPHDPGYAPMYGKLSGLPPMLIHYAPDEMLAGQIRRFADKAVEDGASVTVVELPGLWHSVHVLAGTLRAATDAVHDAGIWARARLS